MNVLPTIRNMTSTLYEENQNRLSIVWILIALLLVIVAIIIFLLAFVVLFKERFKIFHIQNVSPHEREVVLQRCG